jgi:hypothetical protein
MLMTPYPHAASNGRRTHSSTFDSKDGGVEGQCVIDQGRATALPCQVLDISVSGARLGFEAGTSLPGQFVLQIESENVEITCERVWVRGTEMGVRFLDRFKPIPVSEDLSSARLW